jgi:hypothetical protein
MRFAGVPARQPNALPTLRQDHHARNDRNASDEDSHEVCIVWQAPRFICGI